MIARRSLRAANRSWRRSPPGRMDRTVTLTNAATASRMTKPLIAASLSRRDADLARRLPGPEDVDVNPGEQADQLRGRVPGTPALALPMAEHALRRRGLADVGGQGGRDVAAFEAHELAAELVAQRGI